jgi:hypothetical protein
LSENTTYYYKVAARNNAGTGRQSGSVSATTHSIGGGGGGGSTPLTANVWANGNLTTAYIEDRYSFSVNSETTYYVWWNGGYSGYGDGTKTADIDVSAKYSNGTTIFNWENQGWTNATSFTANQTGTVYLTVRYYDGGPGTGTYGIVYSTSSSRPSIGGGGGGTTVPGVPTGVTATAQSSSSIKITWNAPISGGAFDYYVIYGSTSSSITDVDIIDVVESTKLTYTDTGLSALTTYYYKVSAWNNDTDQESLLSTIASATTPPKLLTPTGLAWDVLTWTWNPVPNASDYVVYIFDDDDIRHEETVNSPSYTVIPELGLKDSVWYGIAVIGKGNGSTSDPAINWFYIGKEPEEGPPVWILEWILEYFEMRQ